MPLSEKFFLVTGASRGIGRAIAIAICKQEVTLPSQQDLMRALKRQLKQLVELLSSLPMLVMRLL